MVHHETEQINLDYGSPGRRSIYAIAHHEADQFILWFTMKDIKLYYGSPLSHSTMAHYEADQSLLRLTTKPIKLYYGSR